MEWKLSEERKKQYDGILLHAQDLETTIGSSYYRIQKLVDMRKEIDTSIKGWWEEIKKEVELPDNKDYMITREGVIQEVEKPAQPTPPVKSPPTEDTETIVGANVTELK